MNPIRLLAAAAASALLLSGCAGPDTVQPDADGNVALSVYHITTVDSAVLYLGVEQGFFAEEGLDVTVKIAESGSAIIPSVVNGESPIGYANVVSDLAAIDQGLDIKFVGNCCGTGSDPAKDASGVFVLPDSGITDASGLAGKRIAVNSTKNLGDLTIPLALRNRGIDPGDIQYVPMNYSDMGAALERGDVDAIWQVDPFRAIATEAGYRNVLSNFVEALPDTVLGYYITSGTFAKDNPEVVAKFQRALSKSNEYATEHQDELRSTAVEKVKVDPAIAEQLHFATFPAGLDVDSIRRFGRAAAEAGIISKEPDYDQLVVEPQG